jgi:hypothetical protein
VQIWPRNQGRCHISVELEALEGVEPPCAVTYAASLMACPTATILFDDYARTTEEFFEATDTLANLVGQHGQFEEEKECVKQARKRCGIAHLALQEHWKQHNCRDAV